MSGAELAWELLEQVPDPEIPVLSIRELGILREIHETAGGIEVVITPTYSGCPAMGQIEDDVRAALRGRGVPVKVVTRLAPAWTTDWITEPGRRKLQEFGIAPPQTFAATQQVIRIDRRPAATRHDVPCPHCGSSDTTETSHFSSTACKALYRCLECREPFDYFKPY